LLETKRSKKITLCPKNIIIKGAKESYVADGWKLHKEFAEITGYSFPFDIIDYFSEFMGSFAIKEFNPRYTLLAIKEFFIYVGYHKILQIVNGLKYNNLID